MGALRFVTRRIDSFLIWLLGGLLIGIQVVLHHRQTLTLDVETMLVYIYCAVCMGALVLFSYVYKHDSLPLASNYLLFYSLVLFWFIPHAGVTHEPFLFLYWCIAVTIYGILTIYQECIPLLSLSEQPDVDYDAMVYHARHINAFAEKWKLVPPSTTPSSVPMQPSLLSRLNPFATSPATMHYRDTRLSPLIDK